MLNMKVEDLEQTEERVITLNFRGALDFKINEAGELIDGDETLTIRELYNAINPIIEEEVVEEEIVPEATPENY